MTSVADLNGVFYGWQGGFQAVEAGLYKLAANMDAGSGGAGSFSTLTASGAVTLSPANAAVTISPTGTGTVTISPVGALTINPTAASTMDNVAIGGTTPLAVKATTLTATSTVSLSPASKDVTISPTGTGKFVSAGATAGSIDNVTVGVTTPLAVKSTTLTATGAVSLSPASADVTISPTGTGKFVSNGATAGSIDNVTVGATTPLAGKFTGVTGTSLTVTGNLSADGTKLGFYGTAGITQQTGVAVSAAGIHAACVALGLFTA